MSLVKVDFAELYRRHLCRHSQFGINVLHLLAVAGIYLAMFGIAFSVPGSAWIVGVALTGYTLLLLPNVPPRLLLVNLVGVLLLLALFLALPRAPWWVYVGLIVVWHRFQVWNHRIYDKSHDMSRFEQKYRKGPALSLLLAIYELPILLNYLVFDRRNWTS
ncbi:MAG: hypothetical protein R3C10_02795 [Pirellulales bacterium]